MVRSGTSMIAGLLWRIGIDMGEHNSGQYEDWNFNLDFLKRNNQDISNLRDNIRKKNLTTKIWGWKDPMFAIHAKECIQDIRNPYFIVVLRDPFAVTERALAAKRLKGIDDNKSFFSSLKKTINAQTKAIELLESTCHPALVISYERAVRQNNTLIKDLYKFSGKSFEQETEEKLLKLNKFMKPGRYKPSTEFV